MTDTRIEFYIGDRQNPIAIVKSDAVPRVSELINIRKTTYKTKGITWAVDSECGSRQRLRANIVLEEVE